jgi:hypothetical protein
MSCVGLKSRACVYLMTAERLKMELFLLLARHMIGEADEFDRRHRFHRSRLQFPLNFEQPSTTNKIQSSGPREGTMCLTGR